MGKIQDLKISPAEKTVNPEIKIDIRLVAFRGNELPISFSGGLFDENEIRFASLSNWITDGHEGPPISINRNRSDNVINLTLHFPLTQKALDHIEEMRDQNEGKDVKARLKLNIGTVRSKLLEADVDTVKEESGKNYLVKSGRLNNTNSDLNLIAAQKRGEVLEASYQKLGGKFTITSSDWAQKFCPVLGVGKFATVDLYLPELAEAESEFEQFLENSLETVEQMEYYLRQGEWSDVIKESRQLAELVREKSRFEEWNDILTSSGYNDQTIGDLNGLIQSMFNFSSKFVHRTDTKKNLMTKNKVEKEDAYFIYASAVGLVNLLSRKVQEFKKHNND